jgi:hypothetical protein
MKQLQVALWAYTIVSSSSASPQPHRAPIPKPTITFNSIPSPALALAHRRPLSRDSELYIHPFSTFIVVYPFPRQVVVAILLDKFFQAIASPLKRRRVAVAEGSACWCVMLRIVDTFLNLDESR